MAKTRYIAVPAVARKKAWKTEIDVSVHPGRNNRSDNCQFNRSKNYNVTGQRRVVG